MNESEGLIKVIELSTILANRVNDIDKRLKVLEIRTK